MEEKYHKKLSMMAIAKMMIRKEVKFSEEKFFFLNSVVLTKLNKIFLLYCRKHILFLACLCCKMSFLKALFLTTKCHLR